MKKMIGLSLVALLCISPVYAQKGEAGRQKEKGPSARIERTIKDLNLDEKQAAEFREIEKKYGEQFKKERDEFKKEKKTFGKNVKAIHDQKEAELKAILNEEQYAKYQQKEGKRYHNPDGKHKAPQKGKKKGEHPGHPMCDPGL